MRWLNNLYHGLQSAKFLNIHGLNSVIQIQRKMTIHKTQVGIIGAGPSGLLLAQLLHLQGIETIILENRSRERVESRLRAGLLEQNTVDVLRQAQAAERLDREGLVHHGVILSYNGRRHHVPLSDYTEGSVVTIYGQQEVVKDLIKIRLAAQKPLFFEAEAHIIEGLETGFPRIIFTQNGEEHVIECDFVAGCDGFHGIARRHIPSGIQRIYDKIYPYSWLGILAKVAPSTDELIYAFHERGFAMHSMRSSKISRLYIQVPNDAKIEDWTDEKIWAELQIRLHTEGWTLAEGTILEKGITPMRSFVSEPMQHGSLFLAGDAAHIVPPTGAKGMNLAVCDTQNLYEALLSFYKTGDKTLLNNYGQACLSRVWRVQDFSNYMTDMFHLDENKTHFEQQLQKSKFDLLTISAACSKVLAENYVGVASKRASELAL
jgi:p-hydroxybenzoate 3-monooxygenase